MQLKRCLLTPLLFAQMWVGADVLPFKTQPSQENATSITLRVVTPEAVDNLKIDEKKVLTFCLIAFLISIICFGKKYFLVTKLTFKIKKENLRRYLKSYFLTRTNSKTKNSYYWHFYSALNLLKSA